MLKSNPNYSSSDKLTLIKAYQEQLCLQTLPRYKRRFSHFHKYDMETINDAWNTAYTRVENFAKEARNAHILPNAFFALARQKIDEKPLETVLENTLAQLKR